MASAATKETNFLSKYLTSLSLQVYIAFSPRLLVLEIPRLRLRLSQLPRVPKEFPLHT